MFYFSKIRELENRIKKLEKQHDLCLEHIAAAEKMNWKQWDLIAKLWEIVSKPYGG